MNAPILYWFAAFLALGGAGLYAPSHDVRRRARQLMLYFVSAFVLWTLFFSIGIKGRITHSAASMESDRAELMLKLDTAYSVLEKHMPGKVGSGGIFGTRKAQKAARANVFKTDAAKILEDCLSERPDSSSLKTKLAILSFALDSPDSRARALALAHELANRQPDKDKRIGLVLAQIYEQPAVSIAREAELKQAIESSLPPGWYRDACLLRLYQACADKANYQKLTQRIDDRAAGMMLNIIYVVVFAVVVMLIGLLVIVVQLFLIPGRKDRVKALWTGGPPWDLKTVYLVFICWLATEIALGSAAQWYVKNSGLTSAGALPAALATAGTYAVGNMPALFYIYWFACRPAGISLSEYIGLKLRTAKYGPLALCAIGLATWCAAVAIIVLACYFGSKLLGSQGSSNPILNLALDAARSSDFVAIGFFYATLGVLAPLCEESLFRGFLYTNLRKRFGAGVSLLVSASLFAVAHLDPGAIVQLLCLGLVFAYVFEQTRSIVPSMIAHGLWNSGSFTLMLLIFAS